MESSASDPAFVGRCQFHLQRLVCIRDCSLPCGAHLHGVDVALMARLYETVHVCQGDMSMFAGKVTSKPLSEQSFPGYF